MLGYNIYYHFEFILWIQNGPLTSEGHLSKYFDFMQNEIHDLSTCQFHSALTTCPWCTTQITKNECLVNMFMNWSGDCWPACGYKIIVPKLSKQVSDTVWNSWCLHHMVPESFTKGLIFLNFLCHTRQGYAVIAKWWNVLYH